MSWEKEVEQIEQRKQRAKLHGGQAVVERRRSTGRFPVRDRIEQLVDPGSSQEVAPIAGGSVVDAEGQLQDFTPANYALATGDIAGRPVVVGGEDFTIRGGSPSVGGLRKSVFAETLALRYQVPLVRLLEGAGGSLKGSGGPPQPPDVLNQAPRFMSIMRAMSEVPVVSAALGPVAGMPAARLAASHFSVMVEKTSQVMIAGPALVERALGAPITKEALGGSKVHLKSGVVHNLAKDEADVWSQIRRFLSFLPNNAHELPPVVESGDDPLRADEALLSFIPRDRRKAYKMRKLVQHIFDADSFFEIQPKFGPSQITGFARLDGHPVGVLANDPMYYAGAMTAEAAEKLMRFVDLCDNFHLPVIALVDQPGFMIGLRSEEAATIRKGSAAIFAVMQARVPWASVMVRKTYGVAGAAHYGPESMVLTWPSAEAGPLPVEGGVAVAFRREIASAPDPEAKRRELEDALGSLRNPFAPAEAASVHDLIDPRHTRARLCKWVRLVWPLLKNQLTPAQRTLRP